MSTVTSKTLAAYNLAELKKRGLVENPDPSVRGLQDAVEAAITRHTNLRGAEKVANQKAAAKKVAQYMGTLPNGQPKPLLNENQKLQKANRGYNLDGQDTIQMPDGRGVETTSLALAPAYEEGKFNTCPNSPSCKKACLGDTSGNYHKLGGGKDHDVMLGPRLASYNRTQAFLRDPGSFAVRLHDEIAAKKAMAELNGNKLGVRLNVLSDIHPRVWKPIMDAHPDVQFYDYTKNNTKPIAENHHLTYSSTGVSNPELGVDNQHQNWHSMRNKLETGRNVAMSFSHKAALPTHVHDEESGNTYTVLNGDLHDFRPIDGKDTNGKGFIVGLKNKKVDSTNEGATKANPFFVHYDPKFKLEKVEGTSRTRQVRDENGDAIPTNTVVRIAKQKPRNVFFNNDSQPVSAAHED